ncbi:unnamed protein product [Toxocara canis]|uniref:Secreted protein n=1 Tax=Toxocara canis TaxID=6265 RepID=A0A183U867_TOXCA|nr:unnamed protein product [Toxocara canis]
MWHQPQVGMMSRPLLTTAAVLIFITTGTFRVPSDLTPSSAQELVDVVALFKPLNRDAFRNTIHKALCENAAKVHHVVDHK